MCELQGDILAIRENRLNGEKIDDNLTYINMGSGIGEV